MAKAAAERDFESIRRALRSAPDGLSAPGIGAQMDRRPSDRTILNRLQDLIKAGDVEAVGNGPSRRYRLNSLPHVIAPSAPQSLAISKASDGVLSYVRGQIGDRKPVGYNRDFLDSYIPNETYYLSEDDRAQLFDIGRQAVTAPAGTYARHILDQLLIELSWNSSRLEGNTYSLADTQRLIQQGLKVSGRPSEDALMILNHKAAIEFLVNNADEIAFNPLTICNLHALLADNLLPDPKAPGRLRYIEVGISGSTYLPFANPALIEECFRSLLAKAAAIHDPFEQSFFLMVQIPYLQPFDDVNKRVSRLAANIPFIKQNLSPLAFSDVPVDFYTAGTLGVYELNDVSLLRDVFRWAYERSASRYKAVRQSLGEPDPLRLTYRQQLKDVVARVIGEIIPPPSAVAFVEAFAEAAVPEVDRAAFTDMTLEELNSLHEGNFARYSVRPSQFQTWQMVWKSR